MGTFEVILLQDIEKLGKKWERVKVRRGFFQNYLAPRQEAVLATPENVRFLENRKANEETRSTKKREQALKLSKRLESLTLEIKVRTGEGGKLFGSITAADFEEALKGLGISVDRKQFELGEPIKRLGEYPVKVRLHPGVETNLRIKLVSN